jgi:hypothetical protein
VKVLTMIGDNPDTDNAPPPDEMIAFKDLPRSLYKDRIALYAAARDHGPCSAGDPRLPPVPACDLCGRRAHAGRLVSSDWYHGGETRDGRLRVFAEQLPAGTVDFSWLCARCWRGIRGDQQALLAELLAADLAARD